MKTAIQQSNNPTIPPSIQLCPPPQRSVNSARVSVSRSVNYLVRIAIAIWTTLCGLWLALVCWQILLNAPTPTVAGLAALAQAVVVLKCWTVGAGVLAVGWMLVDAMFGEQGK